MASRGTVTSDREMLSEGSVAPNEPLSAAARLRADGSRVAGCSGGTADGGPAARAGPAECVVALGAGLELALDLVCRSRKVTLDRGWSLSLDTQTEVRRKKQHEAHNSPLSVHSGQWRTSASNTDILS